MSISTQKMGRNTFLCKELQHAFCIPAVLHDRVWQADALCDLVLFLVLIDVAIRSCTLVEFNEYIASPRDLDINCIQISVVWSFAYSQIPGT
jgi:hypothetical protein